MSEFRRWLYWSYLAGLTLLLIVPLDPVLAPTTASRQHARVVMTAGHALGYLVAGVLAVGSGLSSRMALAVATAHGPLMEAIQGLLPSRTCELSDMVVDVLGVAAGAVLAGSLARCRKRLEHAPGGLGNSSPKPADLRTTRLPA